MQILAEWASARDILENIHSYYGLL